MKLRKFAAMTMAVAMLGARWPVAAAQPAARHPAVQILPQLKSTSTAESTETSGEKSKYQALYRQNRNYRCDERNHR